VLYRVDFRWQRPSARGGLEPHFRVLLSAIFHGFPSEFAIRVENRGIWRKQKCCKLLQVYVHFVCELYSAEIRESFFRISGIFFRAMPRYRPNFRSMRVFPQAMLSGAFDTSLNCSREKKEDRLQDQAQSARHPAVPGEPSLFPGPA
jgi:hypothetical protein